MVASSVIVHRVFQKSESMLATLFSTQIAPMPLYPVPPNVMDWRNCPVEPAGMATFTDAPLEITTLALISGGTTDLPKCPFAVASHTPSATTIVPVKLDSPAFDCRKPVPRLRMVPKVNEISENDLVVVVPFSVTSMVAAVMSFVPSPDVVMV